MTFNNRHGETFSVTIRIHTVERVREEMGIDLYNLSDVASLTDDLMKTCRLLWLVCGAPGEFNDFASGLNMDSIEAGTDALVAGLCDFLPARESRLLRQSHQTMKQFSERLYAEADRHIREAMPLTLS